MSKFKILIQFSYFISLILICTSLIVIKMKAKSVGTFCLLVLVCLSSKAQTICNPFSTYYGGIQSDEIKSILVDHNKNSYVIGNTYSTDLPVTPGLINDTHSGSYDVFVAKFDSCGTLLWSTYMGGSNFDSAEKMALSADGNVLICGYTSSINTFTTPGCFQPTQHGSYDAFISKISTSGQLIWSTLFGQTGGDFAYDITVDKLGHIIIGGTTTSAGLYTSASSFQQNIRGNTDAFIARFSASGMLNWCTYYGGNNSEDIHVVTTDAHCNVIGAGGSFSTNLNTSNGAHQSLNDGGVDGYLIKLDSSGARIFSSYFGGNAIDDIWGVVCDANLNIYLAGHTNSIDFDITTGAYQAQLTGLSDLYLSKWSPTGTLLKCTLFGGSMNELMGRMVLSGPHEITLAGKSESPDVPMLGNNHQTIPAGNYDALLVKFDADLLQPVWSSYYGGDQNEEVFDLVSYQGQFIVFAGSTNSTNFPLSTNPYQATLNNSMDGFITRLPVGNLITTSVSTYDLKNTITVFPNPFFDQLYVKGNNVKAAKLYDMYGHLLISDPGPDIMLNTGSFPQGVYILVVSSDEGSQSFRLIK